MIIFQAPSSSSAVEEAKEKAVSEAVDAAAEILTVEAIGETVDKALESEIQREADLEKQAVAQAFKTAETEAVKEILTDSLKADIQPQPNVNVPATLEFEAGVGDKDNELFATRDKRTVGQLGQMAQCLFTFLVNPNCFNEIRSRRSGGGGGLFGGLFGSGRSASRTSSRQEAYNRQLRQWLEYQRRQIAKLNATEGGNYTTPFPILPPSPPAEEDEDTTQRPGGFIGQVIQFKLNLIPNLFRTARSLFSSILPFLQNLGGGSGGGGLLSGLGLGGGSSSGSFGNNNYDAISSYRPSSSSSLSDSSSSSSGSSSSGNSAAETSTYRISLG